MTIILCKIGDNAEAFLDFHSLRLHLMKIMSKESINWVMPKLLKYGHVIAEGIEININANYEVE